MKSMSAILVVFCLVGVACLEPVIVDGAPQSGGKQKNKFRERQATDDSLPYPNIDEDALLNTRCPQRLELRWQTEVSSSIYATPLIADINSDGKLEIVVPSFVHYLEVLDGPDGDITPGWPVFHQSAVHSSPLLYDIDNDGVREIALATYNGEVLFFRVSGYLMPDKLEVPRRRVRKDWFVGLHPDPVDRSHPDVDDVELVQEAAHQKSISQTNESNPLPNKLDAKTSVPFDDLNASRTINIGKLKDTEGDIKRSVHINGSEAMTNVNLPLHPNDSAAESNIMFPLHMNDSEVASSIRIPLNESYIDIGAINTSVVGGKANHLRRLLGGAGSNGSAEENSQTKSESDTEAHFATVDNDGRLEADADSSFDLFRDDELPDDYNYDDYDDEPLWGNEEWTETQHVQSEDYVNVDSHILCTPVIADIDNDGVLEMIVAASYFFDREYYDTPEHGKELANIDIGKYVAGSIVVFNLETKQIKWTTPLDLSTDNANFRAYIYSSPTVYDLDGDGNLDILVGTSFGLFYVLDHYGKIREKFPLEMAEIHGSVVAADINDDGRIELLTADVHGNVAAWNTQGDELWETHLKSQIPHGPSVGDVDGDGQTDIVVATQSGHIYVLSGRDGSVVKPYPYRTHGRVMNQVLLIDLNKGNEKKGLTVVTSSFDGYLYLIDGPTSCVDVVDIGETLYSMVLADNVDGGDDLDLVVTTMNGNVLCFSTPAPYHPLKAWQSKNQGRNNVANRYNREGIFISHSSRSFRDEEGKRFWIEVEIVDRYRNPSGLQAPYNVTVTLLVPGNYQGERRIKQSRVFKQAGKHKIELPTVPVRTTGAVLIEMVDKNGLYFSDEFALTFHMYYYKLLKWFVVLPMLGMFGLLVMFQPRDAAPLPSFSRNTDL